MPTMTTDSMDEVSHPNGIYGTSEGINYYISTKLIYIAQHFLEIDVVYFSCSGDVRVHEYVHVCINY